jgi:hypothetical protein
METFQKKQKAFARKEKRQKKAARKIERREEKTKAPGSENINPTDHVPVRPATIL